MSNVGNITALFEPGSVAVVGASGTPGKIGHIILANLIEAGYKGNIYPVNPKSEKILGLDVAGSAKDLKGPLDLAVICLPPQLVVQALEDLGKVRTKAVIVITAGFKEVGKNGFFLEQELEKTARKYKMALLGPNCLGLINTSSKLNASFSADQPLPGNIAFFSQSGALCVAILDWALGENIGFSSFISLGNKAVLSEADLMGYLKDDPNTKVIIGYCESLDNGSAFVRTALNVTAEKPVIMIKGGTTPAGAKAASSHTGAIAGSEQAYKAAFTQSGVIQVEDVETLFNLAQAFSCQPLPRGPNLCVVTNSGGPGILTADACEKSGLSMATPGRDTTEKLRQILPAYASLYNPIDIIGDASAKRYEDTIKIVAQDPNIHAILVLLSPTGSVNPDETAETIIKLGKNFPKPLFTCFMGEKSIRKARKKLRDAEIPCYPFPEPAIRSIDAMYKYQQWQTRNASVDVSFRRDKPRVEKVLREAKARGLSELVEFQAQAVLAAYEMPHPETRLARTSDEAVREAMRIGFPVVMKIASPQISHKSDVGGVVVGLSTPEEVRQAFLDITSRAARFNKEAFISGCLVQAMAPKDSKEIIIGFKRDPQFGPLVMFGLGGIYVEILKDISFRLAPLTLSDAQEMIREIHSYPLLRGVRGELPVDFRAIEDLILIVSDLATDFPEITEADFNPVLASHKGALVADVRMSIV